MICYAFLNKSIEFKATSFCHIVILILNFTFLLIQYSSSQLEKYIIFLIVNL